jgi:hypothetical protein
VISAHLCQKVRLVRAAPAGKRLISATHKGVSVSTLQLFGLASLICELGRDLPERCEEAIAHHAGLSAGQQDRLANQAIQGIHDLVASETVEGAHGVGEVEVEVRWKHGKATPQDLTMLGTEFVAPLDQRTKRLMSR